MFYDSDFTEILWPSDTRRSGYETGEYSCGFFSVAWYYMGGMA